MTWDIVHEFEWMSLHSCTFVGDNRWMDGWMDGWTFFNEVIQAIPR
jgi:hypothetical protein